MEEGLKLLLVFLIFKSFYRMSEYWLQDLYACPVVGQTRKEHKITLIRLKHANMAAMVQKLNFLHEFSIIVQNTWNYRT